MSSMLDNRLIIFAGVQYVERSPFMILVANNGSEIIDELLFPYELGAAYALLKIRELAELYGKYTHTPDTVELQTDDRELMRLAANTAGIFVRPKRSKEIAQLTRRTLASYAADGAIYEIYDIEPMEDKPKPSKLRELLVRALKAILKRLEGEK